MSSAAGMPASPLSLSRPSRAPLSRTCRSSQHNTMALVRIPGPTVCFQQPGVGFEVTHSFGVRECGSVLTTCSTAMPTASPYIRCCRTPHGVSLVHWVAAGAIMYIYQKHQKHHAQFLCGRTSVLDGRSTAPHACACVASSSACSARLSTRGK